MYLTSWGKCLTTTLRPRTLIKCEAKLEAAWTNFGFSGVKTSSTKGQLISKRPYEKSVSSKIPTKIFLEFCPEIFCSFLGASWKLFGLPGDLVSNIINKEGYWKPKKLPGSPQKATKNFRAEIQKYFCWYFGWNWFFIRTFWN